MSIAIKTTFLCAAILIAPAAIVAKPAQCFLSIHGKIYIDRVCDYDELDKDGSFVIDTTESGGRYFAYVNNYDGNGQMAGYWNNGASHARDELGFLQRSGACWVNATAKICAWKHVAKSAAGDNDPKDCSGPILQLKSERCLSQIRGPK